MQPEPEVIADSAESRGRTHGRGFPFPGAVLLRLGRGSAGYLEEPYPGIAARAHRRIEPSVYGLRIEAFEGHLHVRLSGTKPDFADENVVERDPFPVVDSQRIRAPAPGVRSRTSQRPSPSARTLCVCVSHEAVSFIRASGAAHPQMRASQSRWSTMPLPMSEGSRTRPVPGWARHNASSRNKMRFIVLFGYVHRCRARLFAGGAAVGQRVAGIHFRDGLRR